MKWFLILLVLWVPLSALKIAVTFDDFPMPKGSLFSTQERIERLLSTCEAHHYHTAFFCIGAHCKMQNGEQYLSLVNKKGHFLANHSLTHPELSRIALSDFKEELLQTEAILEPYENMRKWFRYPYNDYGQKSTLGGSLEKAMGAMGLLKELQYVEGYVTMNTYDWHLNLRLQEALRQGKQVNYDALKTLYLSLIQEWCLHYVQLYGALVEGEITHTLLLHDNDLNALYLEDIFQYIDQSGWTLVSAETAFKDVSWRKSLLGKIDLIVKPASLNPEVIDQLIEKAHIFE